jgi:TonB-dependent SusC/RagA subfamily outer membrane receptor
MDIESIEVVKGAAAASLYGSRASSGVIQIRTRRGTNIGEGATRWSLRSELGSTAGRQDRLGAQSLLPDRRERQLRERDGRQIVPRAQRRTARISAFRGCHVQRSGLRSGRSLFRSGQFTKNSFNIAQNERTELVPSAREQPGRTWCSTRGVSIRTIFASISIIQPTDKLKISFSGYHSRSDRQELFGDTFFDLINQAPDANLLARDSTDGNRYVYQPDLEGREENPLYVLSTEDRNRKRARGKVSAASRRSVAHHRWAGQLRPFVAVSTFLDQGFKTELNGSNGIGNLSQTTGTTNTINASASAACSRRSATSRCAPRRVHCSSVKAMNYDGRRTGFRGPGRQQSRQRQDALRVVESRRDQGQRLFLHARRRLQRQVHRRRVDSPRRQLALWRE